MADGDTINQPQVTGKELVRDEHGRVVSGVLNPNGRPLKGHSITETIRSMMDEKPEIKKALGGKILKLALEDGDMAAIRLLWNYLDGMPVQVNEVMGKDGEPLQGLVIVKNGDTSKPLAE